MTDESRKAFEATLPGFDLNLDKNRHYKNVSTFFAFVGWSARDAEITALKARVAHLERRLGLRAETYLPNVPISTEPLVTEGWTATNGVVTKRSRASSAGQSGYGRMWRGWLLQVL